jgi:hypothetical protein
MAYARVEAREKIAESWINFAACSGALTSPTENYCFIWHRKWRNRLAIQ